jgi:hypothetical protein
MCVCPYGKRSGYRITLLTTCTTPLVATMLALVTGEAVLALPVIFTAAGNETVSVCPLLSVGAVPPAIKSLANTFVPITCAFTMVATAAASAALITASLLNGVAENAALVGANTVNLPAPDNAPARPALLTAASSNEKFAGSSITICAPAPLQFYAPRHWMLLNLQRLQQYHLQKHHLHFWTQKYFYHLMFLQCRLQVHLLIKL